jgi:nitric oxide reductase subunit C
LHNNKRYIYPLLKTTNLLTNKKQIIMLSKSQARAFFLGGTLVTFLIFIGLTIYSFMPRNDQTNYKAIDKQVVRGKEIWEHNNCMGCHSIMGEGGYYAPELTKVLDRRGEGYVKAALMSPVPWSPNGRKMVAYNMSEKDADAMVAYFKWIGKIDLNGFDRIVSPLAKENN